MAGHSKWANTKRHKAAQDAKKSKVFSQVVKEITIAARQGADVQFNTRLRTAISKAKALNMPVDNIERAIQKGTGDLEGQLIEELLYEGYAPGGVGVIVELTTDNKNRSATEVRTIFSKNGGNLAGAGALSFSFRHLGQFVIPKDQIDEERLMELALDAGADDCMTHEGHFELLCPVVQFDKLSSCLEAKGLKPESAELVYQPVSSVLVSEEAIAQKILKMIDALEALEDVKAVFHNLELPDALMQKLDI